MLRKPLVVTCLVTGCLVLFHVFMNTSTFIDLAAIIFVFSPLLVIWLAYTILKHGRYPGPELQPGEEWGYQDKDKSSLGTF